MKNILLMLTIVALAFGASAETWEIGAEGATISAALEDGTLTLSGNGKTVDYVSAAQTPWAGKVVNNVVFSGDITPGKNLLAGLDENVTINGSMPISTLRKISDAFLAGEVTPAEACGLSLGAEKLVMVVDVENFAIESVETTEEGEVVVTIPVGATEGVYRLRAK